MDDPGNAERKLIQDNTKTIRIDSNKYNLNILIITMKPIFSVLFLASFIFLAGCTQQAPPITQYVCADGSVVNEKALCPTALAQPSPAVSLTPEMELKVCAGMPAIQKGSYEDYCIMGLAGKRKDTSLCIEVSRDNRLQCYLLVAEVKNDPDVCLKAEFEADRCYQSYATDVRDGSICGKIKSVSERDSCYQNLASQLGDSALCDKITSAGQRDSCYSNLAMNLRDASYCNKITNSDQKQNCLSNIGGKPPNLEPPTPSYK